VSPFGPPYHFGLPLQIVPTVSLFERVGLETNMPKTQTMICTPGRIQTQLLADSYRQLRRGRVTAAEWNARDVECSSCGKTMRASSLRRHLADMHSVFQQTVVAMEMLEHRPTKTHDVTDWSPAGFSCPFPGCYGNLSGGWMMRHHFQDIHPMDLVKVPKEGKFCWCGWCGMQVDPRYPRHQYTKECQVGVEWKKQREAAVTLALALRRQFSVHGDVLEQVEVFKYLGCLLVQDDDDIQAIHAQLRKARATWACVWQVLRAENIPPCIAAKFYKAVVQAVLLYGSKTWVLSKTALASLEGFHIRAAYRMAVRH
jgi:hypothetical protein